MPFPDLRLFCAKPDLDDCFKPPGLQIRMPGGGVITVPNAGFPSPSEQAGKLLTAFNSALMPLTPIFDILDILLTLQKVLASVVPPDPIGFGSAIGKFIPAVTKLLDYIPLLSVPKMVKDILKVIICYLDAIEDELRALAEAIARANAALSRGNVLGLPELSLAAQCSLETLQVQVSAISNGGAPLNRLITIINTVASLVPGLGPLPQFEGGEDVDALITAVTTMKTALSAIFAVIPG